MSNVIKIKSLLAEVTENDCWLEFSLDANILDSGVDSLEFAQFLIRVEEEFSIDFPNDTEFDFNTISKIDDFVRSNTG